MARVILNSGELVGLLFGEFQIFGTTLGAETVALVGGTVTLDASFNRGGDTILMAGFTSDFRVKLNGSSVVFSSPDLLLTLPVGTAGAEIMFDDINATLRIASGRVMLGDQQVTTDEAPLLLGTEEPQQAAALLARPIVPPVSSAVHLQQEESFVTDVTSLLINTGKQIVLPDAWAQGSEGSASHYAPLADAPAITDAGPVDWAHGAVAAHDVDSGAGLELAIRLSNQIAAGASDAVL